MSASQSSGSPEFVQQKLTTLLNSPYIHLNPAPQLQGMRFGNGPVDLFSTRFRNFFTSNATGLVAGRQVDKDGLKAALLSLQNKWNPHSANFVSQGEATKPSSKFLWTQKSADLSRTLEFTASAEVRYERGSDRIHHLTLEGDQALFT